MEGNLQENNNVVVEKNSNSKIVIVILVILLVGTLGFICYDKFINTEKPPVPTSDDKINKDGITSLGRIEITGENQIVNLDGKEFKIKKEITVDGAFLLIDDNIQYVWDIETVYAEYAYVTNKYIIFTVNAQDWETITYAIDKNGNQIEVDDINKDENDTGDNSQQYQLHNFKVVDNKLQASGHIFCGLDGSCPDIDLIINYENNKIIVIPKK